MCMGVHAAIRVLYRLKWPNPPVSEMLVKSRVKGAPRLLKLQSDPPPSQESGNGQNECCEHRAPDGSWPGEIEVRVEVTYARRGKDALETSGLVSRASLPGERDDIKELE